MKKYYVSGKIAALDLGAEVEVSNPYAAAIKFNERYAPLLKFGVHELEVREVEEVE
ncbi:hypothetical protein KJR06_04820 [Streptococcus lutetiensis]|uniref:Phage protein n=1 Tax=Streptococcus lutetiensis 033 TaxID=1076934 RepID=A0AB33AMW8_9STRE|nr:hypothetical protein [Streptococcus lutetiensis]AGS05896.1 hypothetical protein KE3_1421 [Streptococcus lutetiensis 033]MBT0905710.1 hypothetical protein [Streptococcus lutetiensis]QBX25992.1 hypothetical protein Javan284_0040 [Streptococcus phage Javan284]